MGTTKFEKMWWVGGYGMFSAHEVECLKIAYHYKVILNLQSQSHNIKRNEKIYIYIFEKSFVRVLCQGQTLTSL
jgi:hypothetical protein